MKAGFTRYCLTSLAAILVAGCASADPYPDYFDPDPQPYRAKSYCAVKAVDYHEINEALRQLWFAKNFERVSDDQVMNDLKSYGGVMAYYHRTPIHGGNYQYLLNRRHHFVDSPTNTAHFTEAAFIGSPYGSVIVLGLVGTGNAVLEWHGAFTHYGISECSAAAIGRGAASMRS